MFNRWQPPTIFIAALLVALLASFTSHGYSPDSYSYLEAARNLLAGQGFTSSILFVGSPPIDPAPLVTWPPVYPLAIAAVSIFGIEVDIAARLVAIFSFAGTATLIWLIGKRIYGSSAAATVAAVLMLVWPATLEVAGMAWSEYPFIFLVLLATWLALKTAAWDRNRNLAAIGIGLLLAMAVLARYLGVVMLPVFGLALFFVLWRDWPLRSRTIAGAALCAAAVIPVLAWLARNWAATGTVTGPRQATVDEGLQYHATYALKTLVVDAVELGGRLLIVPELLGLRLVFLAGVLGIAAVLIVLVAARQLGSTQRIAATLAPGRNQVFLLLLAGGYLATTVAIRSFITVDPLNTRLLAPAYPFLILAGLGIILQVIRATVPAIEERAPLVMGSIAALAIAILVVPDSARSFDTGLGPQHRYPYIEQVESLVEPGSIVAGNRINELNHFYDLTVITFSYYRHIDNRLRCHTLPEKLEQLNAQDSYLLLHGDGEPFSDEFTASYGDEITALVADIDRPEFHTVYRDDTMVLYRVLSTNWNCQPQTTTLQPTP